MPILTNITTPNGASVAFHKARTANVNLESGQATVSVASWASEQDYLSDKGLVWQWTVAVSVDQLANVEAALIAQVDGPFEGGSVVADASQDLQALKQRKWATVRLQRDKLEAAGFQYMGTWFDSDPRSMLRIVTATEAARAAMEAQQSFEIEWVTLDNSTVVLSTAQVIGMLPTLAQYGEALHSAARSLRSAIEAAQSVEELDAIDTDMTTNPGDETP